MGRPSGSDGAPRQEAAGAGLDRAHRLERLLRVLAVLVGLSPFLAPFVRRAAPEAVGEVVYALFAPVCHLNPSRTLSIAGVLMPLCSRCAGIFAGFVTAGFFPRPRLRVGACLLAGFFASVIMLGDVITQDLGVHPVWHPVRLATGVLWGHVFGLGIFAIAREHVAPRLLATSTSSA